MKRSAGKSEKKAGRWLRAGAVERGPERGPVTRSGCCAAPSGDRRVGRGRRVRPALLSLPSSPSSAAPAPNASRLPSPGPAASSLAVQRPEAGGVPKAPSPLPSGTAPSPGRAGHREPAVPWHTGSGILGMLRRAVLGVLGAAQRLLLALPGLVRRRQQRLHDVAVVLRLRGAPSCGVQWRPLSQGLPRLGEVDARLQHLPHGHQIARAHLAAEDDRLLRVGHLFRKPPTGPLP